MVQHIACVTLRVGDMGKCDQSVIVHYKIFTRKELQLDSYALAPLQNAPSMEDGY